jgi:putative membrane protein
MDFITTEFKILFESVFYAIIGILILITTVLSFDRMFKLDLKKELVEDQNVAFGLLVGGLSIAIAIIIAAAML